MLDSYRNVDRGSGVTLLILLLGLFSLTLLLLGSALQLARMEVRTQGIADGAATVAADTMAGIVAGYPCENAEQITRRNGGNLISCRIVSSVASVRVGLGHQWSEIFKDASAEVIGTQF